MLLEFVHVPKEILSHQANDYLWRLFLSHKDDSNVINMEMSNLLYLVESIIQWSQIPQEEFVPISKGI